MQTQDRIPRHRDSAKGKVAVLIRECADLMRGEISRADFFIVCAEDCTLAHDEYSPYLTDSELTKAFRAALKA